MAAVKWTKGEQSVLDGVLLLTLVLGAIVVIGVAKQQIWPTASVYKMTKYL